MKIVRDRRNQTVLGKSAQKTRQRGQKEVEAQSRYVFIKEEIVFRFNGSA